ncbi:hypothetical protein IAD21_04658 [Abditibacteriota bacterium]|nr:hypothetical protein IAD21_04658 [Abditibacteriota bacterium]
MAATISSSSATKLHCRHCGGEIESNSRRVQCAHCGALFPFACLICARNLRSPFPVYDDERYLTFETTDSESGAVVEAKPLCQDHFLRRCPDCGRWFHAHENPGFFRCGQCAAEKEKRDALEEETVAESEPEIIDHTELITLEELDPTGARPLDLNLIALASGGGALIGLICWYLLNL